MRTIACLKILLLTQSEEIFFHTLYLPVNVTGDSGVDDVTFSAARQAPVGHKSTGGDVVVVVGRGVVVLTPAGRNG